MLRLVYKSMKLVVWNVEVSVMNNEASSMEC